MTSMEVRMDRLALVVSKMRWAARTGPQEPEAW